MNMKKKPVEKNALKKKNKINHNNNVRVGDASSDVKLSVDSSTSGGRGEEVVEVTLMFLPYRTEEEMLMANAVKRPKGEF